MEATTRRIIFYALVIAFLIAAPILIAYSIGYTIDLKTQAFEKTGGIFIKSKTPLLSLYLNREFQKETSIISGGALLTGIEPGMYLVQLKKPGFVTWSKGVTVAEGAVTEMRNIVLVPNPAPVERASEAAQAAIRSRRSAARMTEVFFIDKNKNLVEVLGTTTRRIAGGIHSFSHISNATVLFVDKGGFLTKFDVAGREFEVLGRPGFYLNGPLEFFAAPASDDVFIRDASGGLFFTSGDGGIAVAGSSIADVQFDETGRAALVVGANKIEVVWLDENKFQPFEKRGARETILELADPIRGARWLPPDNGHIVFGTNSGIYITELDGRGGRNTVQLLAEPPEELLTDPAFSRTVFFTRDGTLYAIAL